MRAVSFRLGLLICILSIPFFFGNGCSAAAEIETAATANTAVEPPAKATRGATIEIKPNSPTDTVRAFYTALREKRFREAIFLTNLRPAVEGLTDAELKEFQLDFEAIAKHVPPEIEIDRKSTRLN